MAILCLIPSFTRKQKGSPEIKRNMWGQKGLDPFYISFNWVPFPLSHGTSNDVHCFTNTLSSSLYFPSPTTMKIWNRQKICARLLQYILCVGNGSHSINSFKCKYFLVTFHTYFFRRLLYKKLLGLTSRWTIPNWWIRFKALKRLNIYSRTSWKEREFKMS